MLILWGCAFPWLGGKLTMVVALASFGTGLLVGLLFTALKLPLPSPPVLAWVLGIFGIWAGGELWPVIVDTFRR